VKPGQRRGRALPSKQTGHLSAERIAELEAATYPNVVRIVAGLQDNVARKRFFDGYEAKVGREAADKMRRDVWALMQGQRVPV
jgi:predicted Zn-dependent protease